MSARPRSLRVASVPAGHVYVQHLSAPGDDGIQRLADPRPLVAELAPGQWWPPPMLDASWVRDHAAEFDVFHLHFGFDAKPPAELAALVAELRRAGKPFVYTVHDLRNPHHLESAAHAAQLDVLIPAADALITLTDGAAAEIARRWGRLATVIPHPHVVEFDRMDRERRPKDEFVVGMHAKSLRASMNPLLVAQALVAAVAELPAAVLQVNIHANVLDPADSRHDPELSRFLLDTAAGGALRLVAHEYFSDDQLWSYLESLDVSVLPYRFGTHSGWLEACFDVGTPVIAPSCGYYAQQRPCLTYSHDENTLDVDSLIAAVARAYRERPVWQATSQERRAERVRIADAHRALYADVIDRGSPT